MKTIRKNIFETNSSSTHSLCIKPENWKKWGTNWCESPYIPIERREIINEYYTHKVVIITTSRYYKRGESYFLIEGDLQKAQFIASCMSPNLKTTTCSLQPDQLELYQSIYKSLQDYIVKKFDVSRFDIKVEDIYNDGYFIEELIGWIYDTKRPFSKEQIYEIVQKVISDDSIVFICHSDETGPFPEELDLKEINLKELLENENNSE